MGATRKNRYGLPRINWVIIITALALSGWLYVASPPLDNIMIPALWAVAGITAGVWFVFFSAAPRRARYALVAVVFGIVAALSTLFRLDSFTGDFDPVFVYRFAAGADTVFDAVPNGPPTGSVTRVADLTNTTPWDFPQFLGPQRDASVSTVALDRDWDATPPELIWRQPIGEGWSAFAVVNGFAVTMEQRGPREMVTCYDLETGELVWSWSIDNRFDSVMAGAGPRATPTIDEGIVYALTNSGLFVVLDGADGSLLWRHDLRAQYSGTLEEDLAALPYGRSNSPLILGSLVIIPGGGVEGRGFTSLVAYDKKTGDVVWEGGDQQISMSSPATRAAGSALPNCGKALACSAPSSARSPFSTATPTGCPKESWNASRWKPAKESGSMAATIMVRFCECTTCCSC